MKDNEITMEEKENKEKKKFTGKPSIDHPHWQWYPEEIYLAEVPKLKAYDYMKQRNEAYLNDVVLRYFGRKITYREFFKKIDETEKALLSLGVKENDIVTVMGVNSPEIVYLFYALNKMNAIPNMIDPRTKPVGIKMYLNEVQSRHLFMLNMCYSAVTPIIKETGLKKVVVLSPNDSLPLGVKQIKALKDHQDKKKGELPNIKYNDIFLSWSTFIRGGRKTIYVPTAPYRENTTACIVHTGGTTGTPKGVELTNENLNAMVENLDYVHTDLKRHRRFLNVLVPFVAYGAVNGIHTAVSKGWESTLIPKMDQAKFAELLLKHKAEICLGVPGYFDSAMEDKAFQEADLGQAVSYIVGGDALKQEKEFRLDDFLVSRGGRVIKKGYGLTECAAAATVSSDIINSIGSVGIPLPQITISAFDLDTGEEKSYGESGELCITGPTVMKGYYNQPEETSLMLKKHEDGKIWLHSGDWGYVAKDGQVFVTDRIKDISPRSGYKVYPSVIENVVSQKPYIQNCACVGIPSAEEGQAPVVFAVLEEKYRDQGLENMMKEEIMTAFQESYLPDYNYPYDILFRDSLPITSVGKIDKKVLKQQYLEEHGIITEKPKVFSKG